VPFFSCVIFLPFLRYFPLFSVIFMLFPLVFTWMGLLSILSAMTGYLLRGRCAYVATAHQRINYLIIGYAHHPFPWPLWCSVSTTLVFRATYPPHRRHSSRFIHLASPGRSGSEVGCRVVVRALWTVYMHCARLMMAICRGCYEARGWRNGFEARGRLVGEVLDERRATSGV
jgi:hypothetical protein